MNMNKKSPFGILKALSLDIQRKELGIKTDKFNFLFKADKDALLEWYIKRGSLTGNEPGIDKFMDTCMEDSLNSLSNTTDLGSKYIRRRIAEIELTRSDLVKRDGRSSDTPIIMLSEESPISLFKIISEGIPLSNMQIYFWRDDGIYGTDQLIFPLTSFKMVGC